METRKAAEDDARIRFLMDNCGFDALVDVERDRYDFAAEVAEDHGREEPTEEDELDGFRRLIDCGIRAA
jgi:hypothetical protein